MFEQINSHMHQPTEHRLKCIFINLIRVKHRVFGQISTNRSIMCALVHQCIKDMEKWPQFLKMMSSKMLSISVCWKMFILQCRNRGNCAYLSTVRWENDGSPLYYPSVHDVIGLHRLPTRHPRYNIEPTLPHGIDVLSTSAWGSLLSGIRCQKRRSTRQL